jgi:hypothetical protein
MGYILNLIITFGTIIIIGLAIYFYFNNKSYNYKVIVWRRIAGTITPFIDRGRKYKDRSDGSYWFKIKKTNLIAKAPNDMNEYLTKGGKLVECELSPDGIVTWKSRFEKMNDIADPFSSLDKQIMANQHDKALAKRGKGILETITGVVPVIMMGIVLICLFIFYESIASPVIKTQENIKSIEAEKTKQLEIMERIDRNIQIIGADVIPKNNETIDGLRGFLPILLIPIMKRKIKPFKPIK